MSLPSAVSAKAAIVQNFSQSIKKHHLSEYILCDWAILRAELLMQWPRLTLSELNHTHQKRSEIALLMAREYHVTALNAENILHNYERTMPLH